MSDQNASKPSSVSQKTVPSGASSKVKLPIFATGSTFGVVPKNEAKSLSYSSAPTFPPMSSVLPKPAGSISGESKNQTTPTALLSSSSASIFPPMSSVAPKPAGTSSKMSTNQPVSLPSSKIPSDLNKGSDNIESITKSGPINLGVETNSKQNTGAFSFSGFLDLNSKTDPKKSIGVNNEKKSTVTQPISETQESESPTKDYHVILSEFYKKHNPEKIGDVEKLLSKYKVS